MSDKSIEEEVDIKSKLNLSKVFTIGPITGLLYYNDCDDNDDINNNDDIINKNGIVFVGIGGILQIITNIFYKSYKTKSITISNIDSINGIKYIDKKIYNDENNILLYGGKSINIITFKRLNEIDIDINIKYKFNQLDDLVLDVSIIKDILKIYLFIGYAHNFIDIIELDNFNNIINKRRIHCIDVCCLFSMSFNIIDINNINIASGNVFGKVTIWKVNNNNNEHNIINTLIGHEGVIFNIKWNWV